MDKITEKKANKINGFIALFIVIGLFALDFISWRWNHNRGYFYSLVLHTIGIYIFLSFGGL